MIENHVLGKLIRSTREKKGYTQEELAEKIHVTKQAVSNWECGKNRPDEQTRVKISEALGIGFSTMTFGGEKNMEIKKLENISDLSELKVEINSIMQSMKLDGAYESTIRKLLEMTLWMVVGHERYKFHFKKDDPEVYPYDWENIAWSLNALIEDKEIYPFDSIQGMESFFHQTGNTLKDKIYYMAFSTGAELFEDFDEDGYRHDFPQMVAKYAEEYGYALYNLLPIFDNDVMTVYKVSVFALSEHVDELTVV